MTQQIRKDKVIIVGTPESADKFWERMKEKYKDDPNVEVGHLDSLEWLSEDEVMDAEEWKKLHTCEFDLKHDEDWERELKELEENKVMKNMSPEQKKNHRFWHNEREKWRRWRK